MKKKAYTLAEALIAMGIVGLIAALMVPMVSKFKPDINKVIYLKNYDAINSALDYVTGSSSIYPIYNDNESRPAYKNVVYKNYPLYNTVAITKDGVSFSGGAEKFCQVLALSLGVDPVPSSCNKLNINGNVASFTTSSGVDYIVSTTLSAPSGTQGSYKTEILIDVNGLSEGKNQTCDVNPKDPDRFKFVVYSGGQLYPADTKGQAYLTQRSTYRKVEDVEESKLAYSGAKPELEKFLLMFQDDTVVGGNSSSDPENEEEDDDDDITLPPGHVWADWVSPELLRTTFVPGIYCEQHNPSMPAGNYSNQRHVYWHPEAGRWVELKGVYYVSSSEYSGYSNYTGPDANKILQY